MNLHAFDCQIQSYIATIPDRCYRTQFRMTDFTETEVQSDIKYILEEALITIALVFLRPGMSIRSKNLTFQRMSLIPSSETS
jgi:hypothetical protein